MPLDTIYLTRHGVRYCLIHRYIVLKLTPAAPPQLDHRLPHRHLQGPIPHADRKPSRPCADLTWRSAVARAGGTYCCFSIPSQAIPCLFESILPLSANDPALRRRTEEDIR